MYSKPQILVLQKPNSLQLLGGPASEIHYWVQPTPLDNPRSAPEYGLLVLSNYKTKLKLCVAHHYHNSKQAKTNCNAISTQSYICNVIMFINMSIRTYIYMQTHYVCTYVYLNCICIHVARNIATGADPGFFQAGSWDNSYTIYNK